MAQIYTMGRLKFAFWNNGRNVDKKEIWGMLVGMILRIHGQVGNQEYNLPDWVLYTSSQ
jgi:hypothetical protein